MIKAKELFLIDGIGALISTTFLGLLLPLMSDYIGVPKPLLYLFAAIACMYSVTSFWHYFNFEPKFKNRLKFVALANYLYCLLTISLLAPLRFTMSVWGISYFAAEIIILVILIVLELRAAIKKS